ncbi:hypothetical protein SANTM175S_06209 [Streptomyces antimycoticus]|uniref:hypothetical protein n=1 Tax=Streptomyces antimycoticus TaxID=68175 RepID=UPI00268C80D3
MTIDTVDSNIITPMIFMNGAEFGMKKKTTDEPMPSMGSNCIAMPSRSPRGNSGGDSSRSSSAGIPGGVSRGGRFTMIWLIGLSIPRCGLNN